MQNISHDLFLLIANLTQMKDEKRIFNLFVEAINSISPEFNIKYYKRKRNDRNLVFQEICTRNYSFGYFEMVGNAADVAKNFQTLFQNSVQMLAVILDNLRLQTDLMHEKNGLEKEIVQKTAHVIEGEQRFRSIFENLPLAVIVHDMMGKIRIVNKIFCLFTDYSEEELLNLQVKDIDPEIIPRNDVELIWKKLKDGQAETIESVHYRKDGSVYEAEIIITPTMIQGEKMMLGMIQDVTNRRKIEKQIRESEGKYRLLSENMLDLVCLHEPDGTYLYVSPSVEMLLGYKPEELIGTNPYEKIHRDDISKIEKQSHQPALKGDTVSVIEYRIRKKNGDYTWFSTSTKPILDANGKVIQLQTSSRDITEQKKYIKELEKQNTFIQTILDNLPVGLATNFINSGEANYINKKFEEVYGWPAEAMKDIAHFFECVYPDPEYRESLMARVLEDIQSGDPDRMHWENLKVTHNDGSKGIISAMNIPLVEQNLMVSTVWDITERVQAEEKLQHEHDLFEQIADTSPIGITVLDKQGHITFANKRAEDILHLKKDEITQKDYNAPEWHITDYEGNPFPDEKLPFSLVKKHLKPVFDVQHAIEWPNGNRHYLSINAAPLLDEAGKFESMIAAVEDVTEKMFARKKSLLHQQKYEQLFNTMIDGYALHEIICDKKNKPIDYRFLDMNPAFEKMTGLKKKNLIGKTVLEVMPGTEKYWIETYGKVALSGEPIQFENYSGTFNKYFDVTAFCPQQGQFVTIFVDITEQKKAQLALEENQRILEESQKVAQLGHYSLYISTRKWQCSKVIDDIFGIDKKFQKNEKGWFKIVHPEFIEMMENHLLNDVIKGNKLFDLEYKIIRQDNYEERWVYGLGRLEFNEAGDPVQMIGTIQDITKTKQGQLEREKLIHELENKNAELERFTYTVSHDLKSPIVTIQGFIGVLIQDVKNKRYQHLEKYTDFISDAAYQMEHLLKDLLELSRIGRVVNPSLTISMNEIAKNTLTLLNENIKQRNVTIKIQPKMPSVYVDSVRIQEVMNNLVENAIKFMADNQDPIIEIGSKNLKTEYQFFIKDNGIGIDAKYHEKIFGLFDQLNKKFDGTGVGLSLVKRIIEFHGGKIWVESEGKNKGSTFFFTLPK